MAGQAAWLQPFFLADAHTIEADCPELFYRSHNFLKRLRAVGAGLGANGHN
jgi:hypothetical protein